MYHKFDSSFTGSWCVSVVLLCFVDVTLLLYFVHVVAVVLWFCSFVTFTNLPIKHIKNLHLSKIINELFRFNLELLFLNNCGRYISSICFITLISLNFTIWLGTHLCLYNIDYGAHTTVWTTHNFTVIPRYTAWVRNTYNCFIMHYSINY